MSVTKQPVKKNKLVILLDTVRTQNTHKLNQHKLKVIGPATPATFKKAVMQAFNDSSVRGGANIVYLAEVTPKGTTKLVARLYQAKRNKVGPKTFKMFSAYHHPDGTRLRDKANISRLFNKSINVYPSRPPIPEGMNTLLKKIVKV